MYFSSARAAQVLGYRTRPWQEGVADAVTWFREQGMLR
jgi:dihydroflavonol-4-reductase